jgi:hypothetical protein
MANHLDLKAFRTAVNLPDIRAEFWDTAQGKPDTSLGHWLLLVAEKYDRLATSPLDRVVLKSMARSPRILGEMVDAAAGKPDADYGSVLAIIVEVYQAVSKR